jgi:hypothetical protein
MESVVVEMVQSGMSFDNMINGCASIGIEQGLVEPS